MQTRSAAVAAAVVSALVCAGCASIVSGHNQSISVVSTNQGVDLIGAHCSLVNDKGTWYATTPGSVTVRRSFTDLAVDCAADTAPRGRVAVKSTTKGMVAGNLLFGGVIGVGVDTVSGAAYDYPAVITVRMGRTIDAATYASEAASQASMARAGVPSQAAPAATADAAQAIPSASTRTRAREHRKRVPATTDYASSADATAVPVRAEGKERYLHYLTLPSPKAFVVYESGGWRFFHSDIDAMSKVLDYCAREGRTCWLYAVDDQVVWSPDREKRIGKSAQLAER